MFLAACFLFSCQKPLDASSAASPPEKAVNPVNPVKNSVSNGAPNPSFEQAGRNNRPAQWRTNNFGGKAAFEYANIGHTGQKSVLVSSEEGADAGWSANVPLEPFAHYKFTGWIKTENLTVKDGAFGALFNFQNIESHTKPLTGTNDWTKVECEFDTGSMDGVQVNCLFGGWGLATGKAWYDDVNFELLSKIKIDPDAVIDVSKKRQPISKYIYGQFIEHLGRCIYGGIWAEMLEDRKFWYPVNESFDPNAGAGNPYRPISKSPWKIIGDKENVTMTKENAYVGEHTPEIKINEGAPAGIAQGELAVIEGKKYVGRVVLSGDETAGPVKVSLVWGQGPADRASMEIEKISAEYKKFPFELTAKAATDNAKLEITAYGKGKLRVGTASIMPADNIKGMRADTIKLLKELNSPVYRWPGGNFVSGYNWRDGIDPDRDKRPPRKNPAWTGVEHNDFGMHEYFIFLAEVNSEPFIALNAGTGSSESAVEELEYVNGNADTPMGKLRIANGGPAEPWKCKYWAVGNEMSGNWQLGSVPLDQFIKRHNEFSARLLKVDPTIKLVASGEATNGSVNDWDKKLLAGAADYINLISKHFYCQDYRASGLMSHVMLVPESIRRIAQSHRTYLETIPEIKDKDIKVSLDEWNYWYGPHVFGELGTRYFLKDGLGIAAGINEYSRNTDVIFMANYAQTVNVIGCIKTSKTAAEFETTGLVLKLYRNEYGTIPVEVGGKPLPLDVAAALTADAKKLTISIINPTDKEVKLPLEIKNIKLSGSGRMWVMTGSDPLAYNEPGKPRRVDFVEKPVSEISKTLTVPPMSDSLYVLEIK